MRVLSNEEVEQLLPMSECIALHEEMYRDFGQGLALLVPRVDSLSPATEPDAHYAFKEMGGTWPRRRVHALRINSDIVANPVIAGARRRVKQPKANGRWVGLVLVFSSETGALLAMFPDGVMQRLRVGAASGIALGHLAREDARTLAIIGSGWQAGAQLMAALCVRPFERVSVFSPRRESRDAFVAQVRQQHPGIDIRAADSAEACVRGADTIMASTSSMVRVLDPAWLTPGIHVSCIKTEEVDQTLLDRCDRVVLHIAVDSMVHTHVMAGTPDVPSASGSGWWNAPGGCAGDYPDLTQLVAAKVQGRVRPDEITCFVNNGGNGLQFAAAGALVLERAAAAGIGRELPDDWFSESVHP